MTSRYIIWAPVAITNSANRKQNIVSQVPALDSSERKAISQLLPRVRRKVKIIQTSTGKNVQYMEPAVISQRILDSGKNHGGVSRTAAWVCIPYFSLETYSGLLSAESSSEFPIQTLLQAQYSKTARERDLQQAVCQLSGKGSTRCFHVAQLWCLILDKCRYFPLLLSPTHTGIETDLQILPSALLLTYGRMAEDALLAQSRDSMTQITMKNSAVQVKSRLIVSYRGCVVWGFALEECQTWTVSRTDPGSMRTKSQVLTR